MRCLELNKKTFNSLLKSLKGDVDDVELSWFLLPFIPWWKFHKMKLLSLWPIPDIKWPFSRLGAHVILVPVKPEDICTCISQVWFGLPKMLRLQHEQIHFSGLPEVMHNIAPFHPNCVLIFSFRRSGWETWPITTLLLQKTTLWWSGLQLLFRLLTF